MGTAVVLVYGLWVVRRYLVENHRPGTTAVLPNFGYGNLLTIGRGLAIGLVAGFIFTPSIWELGGWWAWLPMLLYTAADVADYFDGFLARKTNHVTALGARLDMEFDGLGMVVVSVLAVHYGQLPLWYLLLGLGRYLFVFGLWVRRRWQLPIHDIPPSVHRRVFAGFQMGFMSAVLWPIVPPAGATIAGTMFALATAVSFGRDWLVAIGRLDPTNPTYNQALRRVYHLTRYWLPVLARLVLFVGILSILQRLRIENLESAIFFAPEAWITHIESWGLPNAEFLAQLLVIVGWLGATAVVFGFQGRLFSFLLVFPLGFDIETYQPTLINGLALACAIYIMLLGTGKYALWQLSDQLLRPAGSS